MSQAYFPTIDEKLIRKIVLDDLRECTRGKSILRKIIPYPLIGVPELYIGPGQWEINDFNMREVPTRKLIEEHPDYISRIKLADNEARAQGLAFWHPLFARQWEYKLAKEGDEWKIKERRLTGMS